MHHRPILTQAPKNTTVRPGETCTFQCIVLSDLHPHVVWTHGKDDEINSPEEINDNHTVKVPVGSLCGLACDICCSCACGTKTKSARTAVFFFREDSI